MRWSIATQRIEFGPIWGWRAVASTARRDSICWANYLLLDCHVDSGPAEVDINASLRGGKQDRHTGLIRHGGDTSPTGKSHPPVPRATRAIMTVEIMKLLQVVNLAVSGSATN
jgi:hypothetical protein